MRLAFSTVACPHWTLESVADFTRDSAYDGVELRSFPDAPEQIVCEPSLTAGWKLRERFAEAGAAIASVATGVAFHEPIRPPIIGRAITDTEKSVRACQRAIVVADDIGAPMVRVFGNDVPKPESRTMALRRIGQRAQLAVDRADKRGVRLCFENAGGFAASSDLAELIKSTGPHPLVGACLSPAVARRAGDEIHQAIDLLGDRLWMVRLTDSRKGTACALGEGDEQVESTVRTLARRGFAGWIVFEWPALWVPALDKGACQSVLHQSAQRVHEWIAAERAPRPAHAVPA